MMAFEKRAIVVLSETDHQLLNDDQIRWIIDWLEGLGSHHTVDAGDGVTLYLPVEHSDEERHVLHLKWASE